MTDALGSANLQDIVAKKSITLKGMVGIYPAATVGDDMELYTDEARTEVSATFHGLRQQAEKDDNKEPYLCLSDFIAPKVSASPRPMAIGNVTFDSTPVPHLIH